MPGVEAFSSLPFLQIFVGGITLLISVWMMIQAQRDKKAVPAEPMPDGRTMFAQGLDSLRDVVHAIGNLTMVMTQIERNQIRVKDELTKETERLTDQTRIQTERLSEETRLQTERHVESLRSQNEILRVLADTTNAILREIRDHK